ncbi:MAG: hypothetical protein ACKVQT_20670 [Burkholderiales bacterium]
MRLRLSCPSAIAEGYYLLIVHKDMPVNTMQELIGWLKANPSKSSYIRRLNDAVVKIQKKQEFAAKLETCGAAYMLITTPAELTAYLHKDRAMWAERIAAAQIKSEYGHVTDAGCARRMSGPMSGQSSDLSSGQSMDDMSFIAVALDAGASWSTVG